MGWGGALREKPGGATGPKGGSQARTGCSEKDLRQAHGLRVQAGWAQGAAEERGTWEDSQGKPAWEQS